MACNGMAASCPVLSPSSAICGQRYHPIEVQDPMVHWNSRSYLNDSLLRLCSLVICLGLSLGAASCETLVGLAASFLNQSFLYLLRILEGLFKIPLQPIISVESFILLPQGYSYIQALQLQSSPELMSWRTTTIPASYQEGLSPLEVGCGCQSVRKSEIPCCNPRRHYSYSLPRNSCRGEPLPYPPPIRRALAHWKLVVSVSLLENPEFLAAIHMVLFFAICTVYVLLCVLLYALVFPRLQIVKFYRSKAAAGGSKTVTADLAAGGIKLSEEEIGDPQRLNNRELLRQNLDYLFNLFVIFVVTLSIFPGFLSEDTGKYQLGSWYAVVLIAMFNVGNLIGRYLPLIDTIKLESRPWLTVATLSRLGLIPCFYFTAKYGTQGWMLFLCIVLGASNGYLTVCVFTVAPKGYKGPEQNALGNLLVLFLLSGVFGGAAGSWLWLIGKGW